MYDQQLADANKELAALHAENAALRAQVTRLQEAGTAELLDVLAEREWSLRSHREKWEDGWTVWWTVFTRSGRNVSGHPQPNPVAAIKAALEARPAGKEGRNDG